MAISTAPLAPSSDSTPSLPNWLTVPRALGRTWGKTAIPTMILGCILFTNYAMAATPNVKLFDLLVFVAAYTLGFRRGALVAVLGWVAYGSFNPWGPTSPALLTIVAASQLAYAISGVLFRKMVSPTDIRYFSGRHALLLAGLALGGTFVYDVLTNLYTGVSWAYFAGSSDYFRWIGVALLGPGALWFAAVHIGSNILFFSALAPILIKSMGKLKQAIE